jgi:hypothetical protein
VGSARGRWARRWGATMRAHAAMHFLVSTCKSRHYSQHFPLHPDRPKRHLKARSAHRGILPRRFGLLIDVKCNPTITTAPLVLDAEEFQRLLTAAHILQECNDRRGQESKVGRAVQVMPLTPHAAEVSVPDPRQEQVIVHPGIEPLAPRSHGIISLQETARQFLVFPSHLEPLIRQEIRSDSQRARLSVSAAEEMLAEERLGTAYQAEVRGKAPIEQPPSESVQLVSLVQRAVSSRTVRRRISQAKEFSWSFPTVFAVAAILFLLIGATVHLLSPLPSGLALYSEGVHATESLATKPVESPVLTIQPPAHLENSGSAQKRVVKSNSFHSPYGAPFVADENARVASEVENRIRADRRLQMTKVQVRASNGVVTLLGDVGSDAERVAAGQDAAAIEGVEAWVNDLRVITNPQNPTEASQKPLASLVRTPATESSPAEAISSSRSRDTILSSPHPVDSKVLGVRSSSSPGSTSVMKTSLSEPEPITVPYGTVLAVRLTETLSSDLNQPGDTFLASLASPIVISDRVVVPEGADVRGMIVDVQNARRLGRRSTLVIKVTHLTYSGKTYELRSSQYSKQGASRNTYAAAAITGGTGVGAIIGTVLGRGKGAAIGAVLGAAAGTGVQAVTKPASAKLSAESTLSLRLEAPLKVIPPSILQRVQSAGPDFSGDPFSSNDRPVLTHRSGIPLLDTNRNTPGTSPTPDKASEQAPSPPHN